MARAFRLVALSVSISRAKRISGRRHDLKITDLNALCFGPHVLIKNVSRYVSLINENIEPVRSLCDYE